MVAELSVEEVDRVASLFRAFAAFHREVGVVEANESATRLYKRAGFRPFYRELLGEV